MTKRKVLFVTGIRSEYDILYSVMNSVRNSLTLEPEVIITGAHLSPMYGTTSKEIEEDGFPIVARIESLLNSDTPAGRVKSAAIQLSGLVDVLTRNRPDFIVAPMDREEAINVALAGAYIAIPVVHIGGGDTAEDGNVDNSIRHAVTKLSHLHMVTTERSAERVIKMGEEPWRVHVVGALGLDRLLTTPKMTTNDLWDAIGSDPAGKPFALVIQHSILTDVGQSGAQMVATLESLLGMGIFTFVSYPNSDAGSQQIIEAIESYAQRYPDLIHKFRNLSRLEFVNLLRIAHVMVGNSSCGIIEAPMFHVPVVNVGSRQRGREHAENVLFVDHDVKQIQEAVWKSLHDPEHRRTVAMCANPYGDGQAGRRIAELLEAQNVDDRLKKKINTF